MLITATVRSDKLSVRDSLGTNIYKTELSKLDRKTLKTLIVDDVAVRVFPAGNRVIRGAILDANMGG